MKSQDWAKKVRQLAGKYRRTLISLATFFFLYTLLGFFILPWSIQRYLTHTFAHDLQRSVTVNKVRFNPYAVKLQIEGFSIADTDNTPLLSFDVFRFNYNVLSLFRLRYGIEEIALEKPYIKLDANGKGGFTLLDAFANLSSPAPEKAGEEKNDAAVVPALWLGDLKISGGLIDYRDAARAGGFKQRIDLPTVAVTDFYTKKREHANSFELEIGDERGGTVTLGAVLENLKPLHINGNLAINNFDLAPAWQWLMLPVNFNLKAPHLAFKTQFSVQMDSALDLQAMKTSLELKDLSLYSKDNAETPVIQLPLLSVNDVNVNLLQQSVAVGSFQANDGVVNLVLDKQGLANLQTLFAPAPANNAAPSTSAATPPAPTSAVPPAKPWDVLIHQIRFNNYTINVRDEKPAQAFALSLTPLSISMDEFKPLLPDRFAVQIQSGLVNDSKAPVGQLQVNTQLQLTPLVADTKVDLQQFQLAAIQPYVQDAVRAQIKNGALNAALDVHFEAAEKPVVGIKGAASVKKLLVKEQGGDKNLLKWDALDVADISFQLPANELKIEKIAIDKPETGFVINADGSTNIEKMLVAAKPSTSTSKSAAQKTTTPKVAAKTEKSAAPMKLAIGTVDIRNANLGFADLTMKPNFKVAMSQLSGSIKGLSSDPKTQARIDLKGKVDRYAPVVISGKINPLATKPSLDTHLAFNNLELTTFTPYSGTYAGFKIKQGQLSLDINYQLVDNKIQGKNKIVMNQLQLGESVESQKAVDLPLRLAIALLRDENGVIDLGFDVGGDLNDPKFSVGGILWKVLSNMVMKVVTSPFKAIASLAGGSDAEGVDKIDFAAGQSQLDAASLAKLKTAAGLLNKRSNLRITVQGNSLPVEDRAALQDRKLANILQQDSDAPLDVYLSSTAAVDDGGAYRALNRYYKKQNKEDLGDLRDKIAVQLKAKGENPDSDALKRAAYEQAWKTARDKIEVKDDELRQLALERATQIKSALVEQNGVAPERVFVLDVNTDPEKSSLTTALSLDVN